MKNRVYLCAGLFAEGPTDYYFLLPLLERLINLLALEELARGFDVAAPVGIDAPDTAKSTGRESTVPAAIGAYWGECTLFIIHSDGAGNPRGMRDTAVEPGLAKAREQYPELVAVACIPVRETEAWMLADAEVFEKQLKKSVSLPLAPEGVFDPKVELRNLVGQFSKRGDSEAFYELFGANVRFEALRRIPAFQEFEAELRSAIRLVAGCP